MFQTLLVSSVSYIPGTATVNVYIRDLNDNAPEFGAQGFIVYCDQYDSPGSTIDTLSASDLGKINALCRQKTCLKVFAFMFYNNMYKKKACFVTSCLLL